MSDAGGVYVCTGKTMPACSQPSGSWTSADEVYMVSPLAVGQLLWQSNGSPLWQGYEVYWLVPNSAGSNDLKSMFYAPPGIGAGLTTLPALATVQNIASSMFGSGSTMTVNGSIVARNVSQLRLQVHPADHIVQLKLLAQSTVGGRTNSTSYESDIFTRN